MDGLDPGRSYLCPPTRGSERSLTVLDSVGGCDHRRPAQGLVMRGHSEVQARPYVPTVHAGEEPSHIRRTSRADSDAWLPVHVWSAGAGMLRR